MARKGAAHHFAKLDEEKVAEARRLYNGGRGGWSQLDLALEFGVGPGTMGRILRNEGWTHVKAAPVARNITLDTDSGYRAAMKFRFDDTGQEVMYYEGIYDKPGTANQRTSFWRNAGAHHFYDGPEWNKTNIRRATFVDAWVEKATITWGKVGQ